MNSVETGKVLHEHYFNCVKYWMEKGQDERKARLSALNDIKDIRYNPFIPFPKDKDYLNPDAVQSFKQVCLMGVFGKQWKEHEDLIQ